MAGQVAQGHQRIEQGGRAAARPPCVEGIQGHRLLQAEAQGLGAPQPGQGAAAAQGCPQVTGEGAHVGARRAAQLQLQPAAGRLPAQQLQAVDDHRPGGQLQVLAASHPGIGPLAIHMHGRHLGRHLLNRPAERGQGRLQLAGAQGGQRPALQHLALEVVAAGGQAQLHQPPVGLVAAQIGQQPGGGPQGDRQHAGDRRIQRAAMAHALQPVDPPHPGHAAMGAGASRFVQHQKATGLFSHHASL